jgi:UDPglucose 6-dehydrogenase
MKKGLKELARALRKVNGRRLIVIKSTVVPGTTMGVVRQTLLETSGRPSDQIGIAANPEFLAEGTMVRDAVHPDRIVVGVESAADRRTMQQVYADFDSSIVFLKPTEAELVKYSANAALAMRVVFANEVARLAEQLGSDVDAVMAAVGRDPRIGDRFLSAGPGFGGSCFEKDVHALAVRAQELGTQPELLRAVLRSNAIQSAHAGELVQAAVGRNLRGQRIAVLGLSFKAGTDDVRESRAFPLVRGLLQSGAEVHVHDPVAVANFVRLWTDGGGSPEHLHATNDLRDVLRGSDAAVIQVAWPQYARWPREYSRLMRRPLVVDLRRAISPRLRSRGDFEWVGLGVGIRHMDGRGFSSPPPLRSRSGIAVDANRGAVTAA